MKNVSLDNLEKENRGAALPENWDAPTPEDMESQAHYRALEGLVSALPEAYWEIPELKFLWEWSDESIARKLGLSEGAVRMRVNRGRALRSEKLKEGGYERGYFK